MRISDWSSDVCSSDLSIARHKSAYLMAVGGAAYLVSRAIKEARVAGFEDLGMEAIYEFTVEDMPEIGRASCRERVCQYVSISVVAGSSKKKKILNTK